MDTNAKDAFVTSLLNFDSIDHSEKALGVSYKHPILGDLVVAHGISGMQANSELKRTILAADGDTYFSAPMDYVLGVYAAHGFELVLDEPYQRNNKYHERNGGPKAINERMLVWAHREGLVIVDTTYTSYNEDGSIYSITLNGGKIFYNWQPSEDYLASGQRPHSLTSSGSWVQDEAKREDYQTAISELRRRKTDENWSFARYRDEADKLDSDTRVQPFTYAGYHDAREGCMFNMRRLREAGTFLPVWLGNPMIWLLNLEERDAQSAILSYEVRSSWYKQTSNARLARMPEWVQAVIGGFQ